MIQPQDIRYRSLGRPDRMSPIRGALVLGMNILTCAHFGWHDELIGPLDAHVAQAGLFLVFLLLLLVAGRAWEPGRLLVSRPPIPRPTLEGALAALGVLLIWSWAGIQVVGALLLVQRMMGVVLGLLEKSRNPGSVLITSFLCLIVLGTLALMLPAATPPGKPISFVDALFTSTSAVCVTGLIVRDTATEFTRFGQVVILVLIQLGGLGIILFSVLIAALLGSRFSIRASHAISDVATPDERQTDMGRIVVFVGVLVVIVELGGAALLMLGWPERWELANGWDTFGERLFHSVFFSVSSFCNAGFATTTDSLHGLRDHWTTHVVICGLIVVGGLGFPVLSNLARTVSLRARGRRTQGQSLVRLTLHTRLVLATTLALYLVGMGVIMFARVVEAGVPGWQAFLDAHFLSISCRTAGFDTVSPALLSPPSRFAVIFLMFIGGAPGSTAGGIKVTVLAVIALTIWSTVRGREATTAFGRTLPDLLVRKAAVLAVLGLMTVTLLVGLLVFTESPLLRAGERGEIAFEHMVFESVSACSTVGLSMGVTDQLSDYGRVAVTIGMFLGRTGPLAFLVALVRPRGHRSARFEYPSESVVMG